MIAWTILLVTLVGFTSFHKDREAARFAGIALGLYIIGTVALYFIG